MPNANREAVPVTENEYVAELLAILKNNNSPDHYSVTALLGQIAEMQKQLGATLQELAAMRRDLAEVEKQSHPIRNTMQKAVIGMQARALDLRDRLGELKAAVIDGCKKAVEAFKEKGLAALDGIARFFKVRPILEAIHAGAEKSAQAADRAIVNIEAAGMRYHEAGRNLKNVGRALMGKDDISEATPNGKAINALTAPYHAARVSFNKIGNRTAVMAKDLKRLEEKAAVRKPRVKTLLKKYKKVIERESREAPKREAARTSPEL